jgi:hypothetical protein
MQMSILRKNFLKRITIHRRPKGKTFLLYALTVDKGTNFIYNYDMIETKVTRKKRVDRRHIVYQITNLINGNFYIGITAGFKEKDLKEINDKVLYLLEREFKKIRGLKQAYYYRNRSVKAIINFLESEEGADLLRLKLTSKDAVPAWLEKIKERFTNYELGEKFTRNSYLSEFEVFLHDAHILYASSGVIDADKSFNYRVKSALSSTENTTEKSPQLNRAYEQLSSYYENQVEVKTASARIDLVLEHGAVEFKAIKGEGLYAYYKPKKDKVELLKDLEAQVLAASFDEESLPDIGTQIVTNPGLLLVIKCLGKPSAQTIKDFEKFVRKALH